MNRKAVKLADECAEFVSAYNATIEAEGLPLSEWQTFAAEDRATEDTPAYNADAGALNNSQINQIKASAPKIQGGTVRNRLVEKDLEVLPSLLRQHR